MIKNNSSNNHTILVMDDEKYIRDLIKILLEKLSYKVLLSSNGDEAISIYQQSLNDNNPVDVIIMDLSIPGKMNGTEVANKIRALNPDVKIIVSSGHSASPEMTNYKDYGFCGAIEKNFDSEELDRVLNQVIHQI